MIIYGKDYICWNMDQEAEWNIVCRKYNPKYDKLFPLFEAIWNALY